MSFDCGGARQSSGQRKSDTAVKVSQIGNTDEQSAVFLVDSVKFSECLRLLEEVDVLQHVQAKHGIERSAKILIEEATSSNFTTSDLSNNLLANSYIPGNRKGIPILDS